MEPVRVKQEPDSEESYRCPSTSTKAEGGQDSGRSACMVRNMATLVVGEMRSVYWRVALEQGTDLTTLAGAIQKLFAAPLH